MLMSITELTTGLLVANMNVLLSCGGYAISIKYCQRCDICTLIIHIEASLKGY